MVLADVQPLGVLVDHRIDDVSERLVGVEEAVPAGEQVPLQPADELCLGDAELGLAGGLLLPERLGDPAQLVPALREVILAVDPTAPPSDVRTMSERVERTMAQRRFYTTLVTLFAAAALFLAAAGIYGTVSYFVARRTRELAIRIALGAAGNGIMRLVVHRAVRLAVWGVALGLIGVWISTRALDGMVYELDPLDPLTIVTGCLVLALVAVADAHSSVKSRAHFITQAPGGQGAVREVCDLLLETRGLGVNRQVHG